MLEGISSAGCLPSIYIYIHILTKAKAKARFRRKSLTGPALIAELKPHNDSGYPRDGEHEPSHGETYMLWTLGHDRIKPCSGEV